jgi:hypothetical protein
LIVFGGILFVEELKFKLALWLGAAAFVAHDLTSLKLSMDETIH